MYSSFFHNSGVKIYANRVMCDNGQDEQRCRIDTLDELLANASSQRDGSNGFEKSLVLCRSNATCRTATVMIHTAKKHKTCIFTSDMYAESCCIADQEREKFLNGTGFVGMASGEAFEMIGLPPVQHYVFLEFPQLLKRFASLIKQFEAKATDESRPIRIDVIASQYDDIACLKALTVEMDVRRNPLPEWLTDIVLKGIAEPKEDKKQDDAQASEQKIEKMEDFDPYNVKPNTEGKYVIPSRFIDYNNDDTESTDGCLMGNESDDEWQYNYEEFHDYELDDECSD